MIIAVLSLIALVSAQGTVTTPPGNVTTGTGTQPPVASATCDPHIKVCPNANCGLITGANSARVLVASPNTTIFNYVGQPINVTWTFNDQTNPQYPSQYVNVYYRLLNSDIWNPWQVVPAKTTTFTATLDRVASGVYEILVLPDNVDTSQGVFKVGNAVSCIADQFPYSAPSEFRLLVNQNIAPTGFNDNGLSANGGNVANNLSGVLVLFVGYFF